MWTSDLHSLAPLHLAPFRQAKEASVIFVETKRWLGGRARNTKRILSEADDASAPGSAKSTRFLALRRRRVPPGHEGEVGQRKIVVHERVQVLHAGVAVDAQRVEQGALVAGAQVDVVFHRG